MKSHLYFKWLFRQFLTSIDKPFSKWEHIDQVRFAFSNKNKHYPIEPSSPHAMLDHLMDARAIKQSDLVGIIGSKGVVSEVVNRKRAISKAQAKALGEFFHVSPALFI